MPFPTIATSLAAAFAILMVLLSVQTSLRRASLKASHGDAGDDILRRRIRAHGNFAEYAPLALLLAFFVEIAGAGESAVMILALALLAARVLHALGMLYASGAALRAVGMFLQHTAFIYGAVLLIRRVLHAA